MSDITLALRIKADVRQASDALRDVGAATEDLGKQSSGAGNGVAKLTQRVTDQIRQIGELQDAMSTGVSSLNELADKEQLLDRAVAGGLINLDEQAKLLAELDKQAAKLNTRLAQQERAVQGVLRRFDPASAALKQLARDERALDDAVKNGIISANQRNRALVGIGAEKARLQALNQVVDEGAKNIGKFGINSVRAQQSVVTLGRALAQGNFGQAARSLVSLGTATGASSLLFTGLAAAIALPIAALGAYGVAALRGARESDQLNRALIATGGAVGLTTGQLEDSISNLDASNNGFGKNRESMLALIETGKFAGDALVSATRAAVGLSDLTGKSVEQTSALIARVAREPTAAIAELNSKYRLLSASVLAQISDLESQGRTLDATRLATDALGRVTEDRVAAANAGLNAMDGFLLRLKGGWAAMWAEAGRTESLDDEIAAIQVRINALRDRLVRPNRNDSRADIEARINALIADRTALIRANTAQIVAGNQASTDAAIQAAGDNALIALNAAFDASASKTEKLATALRKIQAQFEALKAAGVTSLRGLPLDEAQRRVEEAARKAAESKKQPVADPSVSIIAGLERQLALLGKNTEAERILEEIRSGGLKDASAATKQLAIDLAQLTDSERTRLATEQQIAALTPQLLRDVGREADAAALEIENSFGALRRNLTTIGDTSGLGLLDQALGIRAAKAELATLQQQLDTVMANAQQREQSIQTQLQARLITEAQGRKQISELQLKQADTVQALLPRMQALAQATGSPEALARVQQISAELDRMRLAADLLTQTLVTSFEDGLSGALVRLTESTTSLGEAAVGFVRSIAAALAQLAAQQVAQSATTGLLNLVRGAAPAASPEAAATTAATTAGAAAIGTSITTAGAAAATALGGALSAGGAIASTGITGSGSVAASSMGIAISSAGTVAAAAMGAAITAANIGSSLPGLSGGGYTGPGGKFQPAGIVHAGEFVARAAVVRQPGMLPLLHAINTEGMRAVHRLATGSPLRAAVPLPRHRSSIGYADGGLVGAGAVAPTVNNRFRFINMVDSADIGRRFAATPDFERSVLNVISSNPRAVRQEIS